jgi:hypothetical protein
MAVAVDALHLPGVGVAVNEQPAVVARDPDRRRRRRAVSPKRGQADERLARKVAERALALVLLSISVATVITSNESQGKRRAFAAARHRGRR